MKLFKQVMLALSLVAVTLPATAQVTGTCSTSPAGGPQGTTTCTYAINDDSYAIVPIPFGFPYYGRLFTHSLFFDNGVVSFYSPTSIDDPIRTGGTDYYSQPLSNNIGSQFYYSIMPLWTDLYNYTGNYSTVTDSSSYLRYNWENISQYGYPDRLNTFSLEIRPTGYIGINYQMINIQGYPITAGTVGNASLGEWTQQTYLDGSQSLGISLPNWSLSETVAYDPCLTDPLSSTTCPGYTEAYFSQQCLISALYDPLCPGYTAAYLEYQCTIDPLFSTTCLGYEQAYFEQQCSLDPLYNKNCSGYLEAYAFKNVINQSNNEQETLLVASATEVNSSISPIEAVRIVPMSPNTAAVTTMPSTETKSKAQTSSSEKKNEPKTTRQALAERRQAAARAAAMEKAKNASEELDSATSMEAQVAVQNVVIQAMGYTPGFETYSIIMPDSVGYKPFTIYNNQTNVDNSRLIRGLTGGSDKLHSEMIDSQYRR
jgi:hypothetical protein